MTYIANGSGIWEKIKDIIKLKDLFLYFFLHWQVNKFLIRKISTAVYSGIREDREVWIL